MLREHDLRELTESRAQPCASIFMPTHRAGPDTRQDPIRFKNMLRIAGERLQQTGVNEVQTNELLAPAHALFDDYEYWQHQNEGLALFIAPGYFREFRVPLRFDEIVEVGERFYLKPFLALLSEDARFYLLALSQNKVQLFESTRDSMQEVEVSSRVPHNLQEAVGGDYKEKSLQFHTQAGHQQMQFGGGKVGMLRRAMFFGHGENADQNKDEITRFARRVDEGLHQLLPDRDVPMIVAAVDYVATIYHEVSDYPRLVEQAVIGNPDYVNDDDLRKRAWPVMHELFDAQRKEYAERFRELNGTPSATTELQQILPAAIDGRIHILFVAIDEQAWGRFDPVQRVIERHFEREPGDQDLLDLATFEALRTGATLFAVPRDQMPAESIAGTSRHRFQAEPPAPREQMPAGAIAAIFRY